MSKLASQIIPLVIALVVLAAIGWVVYEVLQSASKIGQRAEKSMAKRNMVFTKDGMKVGVKHYEEEKYVDKTQSWVVKAWNLAEEGKTAEGSGSRSSKHDTTRTTTATTTTTTTKRK
ncbi:uncharacterized protein B0I36DRAFT_132303 [Microdochium trichocladiopsis]|uniref:Uncharacterized protein n=1 Tax=Microdochium trichocladiopsis TaxID=1682393 RepID=A0A9P8Y770_9PEZI|nr:uncharacterized protein B0I36DRAFT_132303 [Microdochium trichocladiopsis]KAH7029406.1 hypothetical protein B0I36DRAFT_132303 [Microdochium trichocladiopsis]